MLRIPITSMNLRINSPIFVTKGLCIRKVFSLSLSHPITVRKWLTSIDSSPGIFEPALQVLKEKMLLAQKKNKTLLCSVIVDDMAIRKHLRWNREKYTGFVNVVKIVAIKRKALQWQPKPW